MPRAGPCADQVGLRRVADPARPRQHDVAADGQHQPEQQRLAARAADDRSGVGAQPPPRSSSRPPPRAARPAGHRAVAGAAGRLGQRSPQRRMDGQARLAERQVQHRRAPRLPGRITSLAARVGETAMAAGARDPDGRCSAGPARRDGWVRRGCRVGYGRGGWRGRKDGRHGGRGHGEMLLAAGSAGGQPSSPVLLPASRPTVTATKRSLSVTALRHQDKRRMPSPSSSTPAARPAPLAAAQGAGCPRHSYRYRVLPGLSAVGRVPGG